MFERSTTECSHGRVFAVSIPGGIFIMGKNERSRRAPFKCKSALEGSPQSALLNFVGETFCYDDQVSKKLTMQHRKDEAL